jgi:glycosyltransferase involved in cell wall biosynthesis
VARALDACLSNSADADQKGRRARALAEDYRWGAIGVRLSELYRDVRADAPSTHEAAAPVRAAGRT